MTLKEFLDLYNFRDYRAEIETENKRYDTSIVRIYLTNDMSNHDYIEFGIYDYSENEYKEFLYEKFIRKELLKTTVKGMYFDYDLNTFCIYLEEK